MKKGLVVSELDFSRIRFWVQVHGLSLEWRQLIMLRLLVDVWVKVISSEDLVTTDGVGRSYLRCELRERLWIL